MTFRHVPGGFHESRARQTAEGMRNARSKAVQNLRQVEHLQGKLDRLKLVTRALWEIVRDNTAISEAMLEAKVKEIDLRSGSADGRDHKPIVKCQQCGRTIQRGQDTCQYCGHVQGYDSVFDWIR
ncbi:MAG: hypothetical protein EA401_03290 [Planctomycetota bacterium]|nr:MAG: hypothetical protein EA401_03290 [Planctomycetota bacterium]